MFASNMVAPSSVQEPVQVALCDFPFFISLFFSFVYVFVDLHVVLDLSFGILICCIYPLLGSWKNVEEN